MRKQSVCDNNTSFSVSRLRWPWKEGEAEHYRSFTSARRDCFSQPGMASRGSNGWSSPRRTAAWTLRSSPSPSSVTSVRSNYSALRWIGSGGPLPPNPSEISGRGSNSTLSVAINRSHDRLCLDWNWTSIVNLELVLVIVSFFLCFFPLLLCLCEMLAFWNVCKLAIHLYLGVSFPLIIYLFFCFCQVICQKFKFVIRFLLGSLFDIWGVTWRCPDDFIKSFFNHLLQHRLYSDSITICARK